ncbi:fimbrial biogenesis chaperone [Burkholderia multivorans]|uniref:fimbrial biogenesis chaperone n=1 Tax=Burkholderia multivorans TaxID=87883 RepID=UPI0035101BC2
MCSNARAGASAASTNVHRAHVSWARRVGRFVAHAALCIGAIACDKIRPAAAGVTPEVSRVVFVADAAEQAVQLYNLNAYPVLVQAWVDDGDIQSVPQSSNAPIVALPPIFRMAPHDQTSLRLINAGEPLPTDRESLFWLNLYEIPATPMGWGLDRQTVTVTMRTQVKLFVRPVDLDNSGVDRLQQLRLSLAAAPGGLALTIENPTPYYATIGSVQVKLGDISKQAVPDMIAPFSRTMVTFDGWLTAPGTPADVTFSMIGDDGNSTADARALSVGTDLGDVSRTACRAPDTARTADSGMAGTSTGSCIDAGAQRRHLPRIAERAAPVD